MGNDERNSFVKEQIIQATLKLLNEEESLSRISISDITIAAQVSRNSFYRNYNSKEDIIKSKIDMMLTIWGKPYDMKENVDLKEMYGELFNFILTDQDFFLLLQRKNIFYLFKEVFIQKYGASETDNNLWAYIKSFISYGTFGWIEEWVARGMQESAEEMKQLLSSQDKAPK